MDTNDVRSGILKIEDGSATIIIINRDKTIFKINEYGILRMDTNDVRSGKLVSIEANNLEDGSAIDISNDGSSLSTGSLIKLSSKSTNVTNGILRMDTNDVRSGKLVSIEANNLEDGSAIDISNDGSSLSTGSLIKLTSNVKGDNNGANGLVKIVANDMTDGKGIVLEGKKSSQRYCN